MIASERQGAVTVLSLDRGPTNPIDLALLEALEAELAAAAADDGQRALVLGSAGDKFLSIGFDIPALFPLDREGMRAFFRTFNRASLALYEFPKPTVAAVAGHAVAGGCILALCCDRRLLAAGHKVMGLNEVKLGVPLPYLCDRILRDLVGTRHAREIAEEGEFFGPEDCLRLGLVDRVLPLAELRPAALAEAERLGAMPAAAFARIKADRVEDLAALVRTRQEEREEAFLDLWFAAETRGRLEAAMERF